jgi:hypothetical protein
MATKIGMRRKTARRAFRPNRAVTKLKDQLQKANSQKRQFAKKAKEAEGGKVSGAVCVTAGGAAAGAVSVYMPQVAGFQTPLVVGAGLVVASVFIKDAGIAGPVACLGSGMLAAWASGATSSMLSGQSAPSANGPTIVNGVN